MIHQQSRNLTVLHAGAAGIATGMRSMSALAAASAAAHRGDLATGNGWANRLFRWRGTTLAFGLATVGEMVVDKLPIAPSRLEPGPLIGRAVLGGLAGAIISRGRGGSPVTGLLAGCAGAMLSTQAWGRGRAAVVTRTGVPDPVVAVVEDGLAVAVAYLAAYCKVIRP